MKKEEGIPNGNINRFAGYTLIGLGIFLGVILTDSIFPHKKYSMDLNGDGIRDIVKVNRISHTKSYYLSQPDGTYVNIETLQHEELVNMGKELRKKEIAQIDRLKKS